VEASNDTEETTMANKNLFGTLAGKLAHGRRQ
jgi:hypothetical protein